MAQCKAITKTGKRCRASATDTGLCFFHAHPDKAVELGRQGGRRGRVIVSTETFPVLPPLESAMAVRDVAAHAIQGILAGTLNVKVAAISSLLNVLLRSIDLSDVEKRLKLLEEWKNSFTDFEKIRSPKAAALKADQTFSVKDTEQES